LWIPVAKHDKYRVCIRGGERVSPAGPSDPGAVAVYVRWSTDDQGHGHTLEIQSESCRHYLLSQGWLFQEHLLFVDDGWSGASLARPALTRLRARVAAGEVQCVVVYKIDRLSRSIPDMVALVLTEWEGRCCLRSATEPVDTTSDTGRLLFTLLSTFADFERSTIAARTFGGKHKNAQKGRNPGMPYPVGYERGDLPGLFRVVPAEACAVQTAFELYVSGHGCARVAQMLNAKGLIPAERLGPWTAGAISRMLANPIYRGRLVYGRRPRRPRPVDALVAVDLVPVIVTPELWDAAAALREARRPARAHRAAVGCSRFVLTGLLRCGGCGQSVTGVARSGRSVHYYWCAGHRSAGLVRCPAALLRQDLLEGAVVARVVARYRGAAAPGWAQVADAAAAQAAEAQAAAAAQRQRAGRLEQRLARLGRDYAAGLIDAHTFAGMREDAVGQAAAITEALIQTDARHRLLQSVRERAMSHPLPVDVDGGWSLLTLPEQRQVLRHLIGHISVYRAPGAAVATVSIHWQGGRERS